MCIRDRTWHGAGPVMAQKIMIQRITDYEHEKELVRDALKIEVKEKEKKGPDKIPIHVKE